MHTKDDMGIHENEEIDFGISDISGCGGFLSFQGTTLVADMIWHLEHEIDSKERVKFLEYRLEQFVEIFGHFKGATGVTKMGNCGLTTHYTWPNASVQWKEIEEKFISLFDVAKELGRLDIQQGSFDVKLSGTFTLPGKGHGGANA